MKIKRFASIIFASLSITHVVNSQMLPREDLNSSSELQQIVHDVLKKLGENALSIQSHIQFEFPADMVTFGGLL